MSNHLITRLTRHGRARATYRVATGRRNAYHGYRRTRDTPRLPRRRRQARRSRFALRRLGRGGQVAAVGATALVTVAAVTAFAVSRAAPPSRPAEFTSPARAAFLAGSPGRFTIRTANFSGTLTRQGVLPAGLALHDGGSGMAVISGIPVQGSGGRYELTLSATEPGHEPVRQRLALIVDQSPTLMASSTSQRGLASHHLTFRLVATGYPIPRITLAGKLPPALVFTSRPGAATISGQLDFSWLKAIQAGFLGMGSMAVTALSGGWPLAVEIAAATGASAADSQAGQLLYDSTKVTAIAFNGVGNPSTLILTMQIFGPN
jgi:hypothetical protein